MARSFFERLTGSVRLNEDAGQPLPAEKASALRGRRRSPEAGAKAKVLHPVATDGGQGIEEATATGEANEEGQLTVDIYDDGPNIVIQSTVAGVKPEDIDISLQDETLTIRGSRRRVQEINESNFYYRELYWGTFSRSIILPEEVDFQKADAAIKNGLLNIRIPKRDRGEKKIRVRGGEA